MEKNNKYKLCKNVAFTELDGESIIIDHLRGVYITLNIVGITVGKELSKGSKSIEKLLEAIVSEFEVEESMALEDLILLLEHLKTGKLIREVRAQ